VATVFVATFMVAAACSGTKTHTSGQQPSFPAPGSQNLSDVAPDVADSQRLGPMPASQVETVVVVVRSAADLPAAQTYLAAKGLRVLSSSAKFASVTASGQPAALQAAFGVRMYNWRNTKTGEEFYSNDHQAAFPAPLAGMVVGVLGLNNAARAVPMAPLPADSPSPQPENARALRVAYNVQSLVDAGLDGKGQTVAVFAEEGLNPDDIAKFDTSNGLPAPMLTVRVAAPNVGGATWGWEPGANPPSHDPAEEEAELDVEAIHAIAQGAGVDVFEASLAPSGTSQADSVEYFLTQLAEFLEGVDTSGDHVASISDGTCESQLDASDLVTMDDLLQQIVTQDHVSVFAASGDSGKYCALTTGPGVSDFTISNQPGVNYPASDPLVTGVGGTSLELKPSQIINAEQAWDSGPMEASSGGFSACFPAPSWQRGQVSAPSGETERCTGRPGSRGPLRGVPDVAADADPASSLELYGWDPSASTDHSFTDGGTSQAAPLWAAVGAIYDQYATEQDASLLGLANPLLYRLAGQKDNHLFDVTTSEGTGSDLAQDATQGWDEATGLGTPNAWFIVHDGVGAQIHATGPAKPTTTPPATQGSTPSNGGTTPPAETGATAYVTDDSTDQVTPINLSSGAVESPISVPGGPEGIAVTPNGATAYVAEPQSNTVTPINLKTGVVGSPLAVPGLGLGIAVSPDGATLYVSSALGGSLTPISLPGGTVGTPITIDGGAGGAVAITPNGRTAFVTDDDGELLPVELATGAATAPISVGGHPTGIAVTPNGSTAYVVDSIDNTVTPVSVTSGASGSVIPVPAGVEGGIAITPDGKTAYLTTGSATVTALNLGSGSLGASFDVPIGDGAGLAIAP
jgi:kumamolisin